MASSKSELESNRAIGRHDSQLPPGFPQNLSHPLAWKADELEREDYVVRLSPEGIAEIDAALKAFKALGLDGRYVSRDNFPLPRLKHKLDLLAVKIHHGIGFFVLSGLPETRYSPGDSLVIYLGITAYIGHRRGRQDFDGNVLTHVESFTNRSIPPDRRHNIHTNKEMAFHTDIITDILCQQVRQAALTGGELVLAPFWTMYNEIAATRPDVIRTLSEPIWPCQQVNSCAGDLRPVLFCEQGRIICSLDTSTLTKLDSFRNCPALTPKQLEATRIVQKLASKHALEVKMKAGDLVFFNNFALFHSRRDFQESETQRRHIVRLWLRNDDLGWKIPKPLRSSWKYTFMVPEEEQMFLVEPKPYVKVPKISLNSACMNLVNEEELET